MNISMQLAVVVAAACLCLSDAAPEARLARKSQRPTRGFKNIEMLTARGFGKRDHPPTRSERDVGHQTASSERANRGTPTFKSPTVGVARDFGKRTLEQFEEGENRVRRGAFKPNGKVLIARGYGKRNMDSDEEMGLDNFWSMLEAPEGEVLEGDGKLESIPMDWFVNEMLNNPDFARSVVRKFIDLNQDGMLSTDELLRNVD